MGSLLQNLLSSTGGLYDTPLGSDQMKAFKQWKAINASNDSGYDYDLQGAWAAGMTPDPKSGHFPDRFKKPSHPTFSNESQFFMLAPEKAGFWVKDKFMRPPYR